MNPVDYATLCSEIYQSSDGFDIYNKNGVYAGYVAIGDIDLFVFRGSYTFEDWEDDFYLFPLKHPKLGDVHGGFVRGIDLCYKWCLTKIREGCKASFIGHSLGGAHARYIAGLCAYDKSHTELLMTFGSPKCGKETLIKLIESSGITHTSYRHCDVIVPSLPPDKFGYEHTEQYIELKSNDSSGLLGDIKDHSISLYLRSLA